VSDRHQVEVLALTAREIYGRIDVLINNAGLMPLSPLDQLKVGKYRCEYQRGDVRHRRCSAHDA
jgi:NADP-dependent 3-hydroxy acid dehydrogenase YdfG